MFKNIHINKDFIISLIVLILLWSLLSLVASAIVTIKPDRAYISDVLYRHPESGYIYESVGNENYQVQIYRDFLTHEECDQIIEIAKRQGLEHSMVYGADEDVVDDSSRISKQAWLKDSSSRLIKSISDKVSKITGYPVSHQEDLQVVHYGVGGMFTPHYDPCVMEDNECKRMNGESGARVFTFLIYLNDEMEGGETLFPLLSEKIKPVKGSAILFKSTDDDGHLIKNSQHGGAVVRSGEKWICNKWVRENPYID